MKSRLGKIEIRNCKAFLDFTLNFEGRQFLLYGDNEAGKLADPAQTSTRYRNYVPFRA